MFALRFALVLLSLVLFATTASAQAARPNIVWLVAEDLSPIISAFGDDTVETPNIDGLARQGVRYSNTFSVSGVCAPSRFTLATGLYTTRAGAHNMRVTGPPAYMEQIGLVGYEVVPPPEVKTLSEQLRRAGYYTSNNAKTDHQFTAPVTAWDASGLNATWHGRGEGQPFFAVFNFVITHESQVWAEVPRHALFRYHSLFSDNPEPRHFSTTGGEIGTFPNHVADDLLPPRPPYLPDTPAVHRDLRRVYSNVVELDRQIGRVIDALRADGVLDSTIIVFYSDHGGPLPRQKRLLYDSGLHVPLIITFPDGRDAGSIDPQLVSFVDFVPTTLSLAKVEPPDYLDGRAFLGDFTTEGQRRYIHAAADRLDTEYDLIRAVRDDRFKYLLNFNTDRPYYLEVKYREQMASMQALLELRDDGRLDPIQAQWFRARKPTEELFDTANDPHEVTNLAADPRFAEKVAEMRSEAARWMAATDDKGFMAEAELLESFWPDRKQPITSPPVAQEVVGRLTLESSTEGASIGYQLTYDPADRWRPYTGVVVIDPDNPPTRAIAHRIGFAPSTVVTLAAGGN